MLYFVLTRPFRAYANAFLGVLSDRHKINSKGPFVLLNLHLYGFKAG